MQTDFMGISFTLIEVIHTSHTMVLQNQMKHQSYFYYFDKFLFIIYIFIVIVIYIKLIFNKTNIIHPINLQIDSAKTNYIIISTNDRNRNINKLFIINK